MDKMSCDVVIIGSGIGGLCLAARLGRAGYKTIMLERLNFLGGRYTHLEHKGYLLPTGAVGIYYGGKGLEDPVLRTLHDVGADASWETRAFPPPVWRIDGKDYQMPEKGMLWEMLRMASKDKEEEEKIKKALRHCLHWQEPSDLITFSEWLLRVTDNKLIYKIFEAISVQLIGPNIWEFSAGETFRGLRSFAGTKQLLPPNGLVDVIDSLLKVIREDKCEILPLTEATRIIVQDGIATGIEARGPDSEMQIEAKVVVSNVGPKATVKLAGESNFERGYLMKVKQMRVHTGFEWFVGSDGPLIDYPGGLYTLDTARTLCWLDCTLIWPHWAPKGKNWMLCYQAPLDMVYYDPKKEFQVFLSQLNEVFPNFHKRGGEIIVSHHYNADWPVLFAVPGDDMPQKTPIENLYNVGDGVKPPGWTAGSACAETSRFVFDDIKARIKPAGR